MNPRFLDYKKAILSAISAVNLLAMVGIFAFTWFRFYLYQIECSVLLSLWKLAVLFHLRHFSIRHHQRFGRLSHRPSALFRNYLFQFSFAGACQCVYLFYHGAHRAVLAAGRSHFNHDVGGICRGCHLVLLFSSRLYHSVYPPRRMLLVSGSNTSEHLIEKMNKRPDKYEIRECIDADTEIHLLRQKIDEYDAIVICDVGAQMQELLINYCFRVNKRFYLVPTIEHIIIANASKVHLFDTPLLLCRNQGLQPEQRFAKRALDLFVSSLGILVTSPFMLIIALCIYAYDRGPVLFKQERLTLGGRVFTLYKFRSMVVDAEKDGIARLASKNDVRITPIGKIIRAIRFDELPQLFNIFKGDMSLVGPRPERPEIAEEYASTLPNFSYRLKTKAGRHRLCPGDGQIQHHPAGQALAGSYVYRKLFVFVGYPHPADDGENFPHAGQHRGRRRIQPHQRRKIIT